MAAAIMWRPQATRIRRTLHVPNVIPLVTAPAEAVWAVVSDGWLYANWVVGSRVRAVDPGWPAEGCRIHHSFGVWPAVIDDGPSSSGRYPVNGCT